MIDRVNPDPKCHDCGGTGHVRAQFDCECLLREAKAPLWRRAVDALVGDPRPKGQSMVAGRRRFLQTLATGAVAGATAVALPKVAGVKLYPYQRKFIQGQQHELVIADEVASRPMALEHGMAWYSIWGQSILEKPGNIIVIAEIA